MSKCNDESNFKASSSSNALSTKASKRCQDLLPQEKISSDIAVEIFFLFQTTFEHGISNFETSSFKMAITLL